MNRDEILKREMEIAEKFFGTTDDPEQMPINEESVKKLDTLSKDWLVSTLDEKGDPISWAVVMPTQKDLALRFLKKEINEREILDLTEPADIYSALYLTSVITIPEHRGRGLAKKK